ncbi:phosphoenolpyruvate--protein phosphotransferase [Entomospira culicis]|uniref:Phosphoenolpyruvate-protein phosphotransferase n=1 Tax=Entomospira culicis TaxID=2719989 RepID=A0A968GGU8_9SPIO|nr:phosphoenolpyruvate--protein phosphotransferase [Entomospira culicis]NIZ19509.1 phosphoenolpyruvate--protein phosphotransferase [Entomospira culicis]NIZ69586.1 phosphoenolpyruvate--protein phosphotransferase [Entomospira culicis]WDI36697.1 phosphoenolpyruvate--protein phosphotransferase [Entomospira culicis]WDI38326.1 phosphoenolpyruvate--protein phosphotransferase [Entomospira culicis]
MKRLTGTAIATGIASSFVFLCNEEELLVPTYTLQQEELSDELTRFVHACEVAIKELKRIKRESDLATDGQIGAILDVQILMLQDVEFHQAVERSVKEKHQNVESALDNYFQSIIQKLTTTNNPRMQERVVDLHDLRHRLLRTLSEVKGGQQRLADLIEPAILVAYDMSPSLAMHLDKSLVKGVILEHGGRTSHTAILIRALGIPAVFNVTGIHQLIDEGTPLIVDGNEGIVVIRPNQGTQRAYQQAIDFETGNHAYYRALIAQPSITVDGVEIRLRANAQSLSDAQNARDLGAKGIGLFRSEFIFLAQERKAPLSEEAQYAIYKKLLQLFPHDLVTIRTLDLGADKSIPQFAHYEEANPLLGWRASRLCLEEKELFTSQLRALYRASVHGNLRIMIPFISTESELREILEILAQTRTELSEKKIAFKANVPIGIMIETPSAVLISEQLAQFVDFFSIGTNDLTQYTLAVDRDNPKVAKYYKPIHKSVLKLIRITIQEAQKSQTDLSLCGELATDLLAVPLLLGMGLRELSVGSASLTHIKEVIRLTTIKEAEVLADNVFSTTKTSEIVELLKEYRERIFARKSY